ncbi:MAG: hypothetical protein GWM92_04530 [Gemmatimonadetes bacterium]|nr:hypothetical protein [Gemmatimonadota bacterium]NIR77850.1 hypothetical protein [Gemmatimonadota bacterium]NIT86390.1 hypothetical protein [Gemmatimonadota bacterium]NIU30224.1 hypothetical protein [Gemmatimonadota bacterium]NIU35132.1 hypothetical protein [Gemmatimonadota bacterium]
MLFHAHSGIRYLVLLLGVAALMYALFGLLTGRRYDRGMRILSAGFTGLLDLQIFLGVALLIFGRGFQMAIFGHIVLTVFAAAAVHVTSSVMKRRDPREKSYGPHAVGVGAALVLIVVGIMAIGRPIL